MEVVDEPDGETLTALYRDAAVFVMASHHEGFCVPVVEAQARGLLVVASDAGALPETVAGGGIVVPVRDLDALAAALRTAVDHVTTDGRATPDWTHLHRYSMRAFEQRFLAAVDEVMGRVGVP